MEKDLNGIEYILMLILERIKETGVSQTKVTYGICDSGLIRKLSNGGGRKVPAFHKGYNAGISQRQHSIY